MYNSDSKKDYFVSYYNIKKLSNLKNKIIITITINRNLINYVLLTIYLGNINFISP